MSTRKYKARKRVKSTFNIKQRCLIQELKETLSADLSILLRFEDRNSMKSSIESRVPFLTQDLAEFCLSLPENYLLSDKGTTKYILREAMKGVTKEILEEKTK